MEMNSGIEKSNNWNVKTPQRGSVADLSSQKKGSVSLEIRLFNYLEWEAETKNDEK